MDKMKSSRETGGKKREKPAGRRLVQLYAALLYNANLKGFVDGHLYSGNLKAACVPGLNCYSCPGAIGSCPLGALQNALNAAGHTAPWYVMGILALFGVMLGRTICGWICPMGLMQELLHRIPTPKIRKSGVTRKLSCLKYVFLAVFVIAVPLIWGAGKGIILPAFCKYICPAGTLEGAVGLLQSPANSSSFGQLRALFTGKWVIMLAVGLLCVFCFRAFCRFICPLGAIYGFFNRFALTGVKVNPDRCVDCGRCVAGCPMDIRHVGDHECISCGKCIAACDQGAIALKCGRITLKGPETGKNADPEPALRKRRKAGRIAWGIALAALAVAMAWFNLISPRMGPSGSAVGAADAGREADGAPDLMTGTEVGEQAPDFSTELLSGESFRLSDYRGSVVMINFWAVTCAPCIEELPDFERFGREHPDVEILAVHHWAGAGRARDFLSGKGWEHLDFALDSREKGLLPLLNASDAMPQTIVLDRRGVVTYNAQAPLTYDQMAELYRSALGEGDGRTEGERIVMQPATETAGQLLIPMGGGAAADKRTYTVVITDQNGDPAAGVMLAFCTDTTCRNSEPSNENGIVSAQLEPDRYHVQVIDMPEGYREEAESELYIGPDNQAAALTLIREAGN